MRTTLTFIGTPLILLASTDITRSQNMGNSDFIAGGRWSGVNDALPGIYKEASDKLARKFKYPEK